MKHIIQIIDSKDEFNSIPINACTRIHYHHLHTATIQKVQIKANQAVVVVVAFFFFFLLVVVRRFSFLINQCIWRLISIAFFPYSLFSFRSQFTESFFLLFFPIPIRTSLAIALRVRMLWKCGKNGKLEMFKLKNRSFFIGVHEMLFFKVIFFFSHFWYGWALI